MSGIWGEGEWGCLREYGERWSMEMYFSVFKRAMGEDIRVGKPEYMIQEVGLKVLYYNVIRENTMR